MTPEPKKTEASNGASESAVVQREHLVRAIGVSFKDLAPLTLLSAPLGYGKSTLLSQWRDAFDDSCARVLQVSAPKKTAALITSGDFWPRQSAPRQLAGRRRQLRTKPYSRTTSAQSWWLTTS